MTPLVYLAASHLLAIALGIFLGVTVLRGIMAAAMKNESGQFMLGLRASMFRGFAFRLRTRLQDGQDLQDAIDAVVAKSYADAGLK